MLRQLQQEGNRKYVGLAAFGLIDRIVLYRIKMFTPFYHLKVGGLYTTTISSSKLIYFINGDKDNNKRVMLTNGW